MSPGRAQPPYEAETRAKLVAAVKAGAQVKVAAEEMGISRTTANTWLRQAKVDRRRGKSARPKSPARRRTHGAESGASGDAEGLGAELTHELSAFLVKHPDFRRTVLRTACEILFPRMKEKGH